MLAGPVTGKSGLGGKMSMLCSNQVLETIGVALVKWRGKSVIGRRNKGPASVGLLGKRAGV